MQLISVTDIDLFTKKKALKAQGFFLCKHAICRKSMTPKQGSHPHVKDRVGLS
jgi:hypothetical protein